jgi:hypothetical protein
MLFKWPILTEIACPVGIDGFGLARRIREDHPDIDEILTSGVTRAVRHVFGLLMWVMMPVALMLSADPLPQSRYRA